MTNPLRALVKQQLYRSALNRFDRAGFSGVLDNISLTSLDIGARGGAQADLLPLARCVDLYGFEPDRTESDRLKKQSTQGPWKSLNVLSYALGSRAETQVLNLYKKAGCSSLLAADQAKAALFSRGEYYEPTGIAKVAVEALDTLIGRGELPTPDHIKIDVQGWELEIFKGARRALEHVLTLRTEVCFFDIYKDQPFFSDLDPYLRGLGFVLMGFVESHDWRRRTRVKWPRHIQDRIPYSRGQIMHADALYMKDPEAMKAGSEAEIRAKVKLGLLAAAYEYFDHADACLSDPAVKTFLQAKCRTDSPAALANLSAQSGAGSRVRRFLHNV